MKSRLLRRMNDALHRWGAKQDRRAYEKLAGRVWGVTNDEDMNCLLRGELGLGTFVHNGVAFSDEKWPLIILGDPRYGQPYRFNSYSQRVVLNVSTRVAKYNTMPILFNRYRDGTSIRLDALRVDIKDFSDSTKLIVRMEGDSTLQFKLTSGASWDYMLKLIAARIAYLWNHAKAGARQLQPRFDRKTSRFVIDDPLCVCGYDLTGNTSGICSECGRAITSSSDLSDH